MKHEKLKISPTFEKESNEEDMALEAFCRLVYTLYLILDHSN
jgi:hypothetical protein